MTPSLPSSHRWLHVVSVLLLIYGVQKATSLSSSRISRRDVLIGGSVAGLAGGLLILPDAAVAAGGDRAAVGPIAVIGASGRTGALCVTACLERGIPVRALTRSGSWPPEGMDLQVASNNKNNNLLTVASCDVKDPSALAKGVEGCRGVIYAASASKKGGNAKEVDNLAVVAAADACVKANIGRYILISSTATTRPKSLGYLFTNILGGIMDEKRKGEIGVENLYNSFGSESSSSCSYSIIRPGGLEEPKKNEVMGPTALEISQGDTLAGIISRADLAQVAVELAACDEPNLRNTALELYYTDSTQPCEGRFKPLLTNGVTSRLHGQSYKELFSGIQPHIDFYEP